MHHPISEPTTLSLTLSIVQLPEWHELASDPKAHNLELGDVPYIEYFANNSLENVICLILCYALLLWNVYNIL